MPDHPPSAPLTPLQSEFASDPDMSELIDLFVTELPARVDSIVAAFRSGDADVVKRISHQLKGAAGGYGFPTMGEAASVVERTLKTSADPQQALASMTDQVRALVDLCCRAAASSPNSNVKRPQL